MLSNVTSTHHTPVARLARDRRWKIVGRRSPESTYVRFQSKIANQQSSFIAPVTQRRTMYDRPSPITGQRNMQSTRYRPSIHCGGHVPPLLDPSVTHLPLCSN